MKLPFLLPFTLLSALATAQAKAGDVAPEMLFATRINFGDLKAEKLSQLRGSAVLLEFFVTGFDPCVRRVPALNQLHAQQFKKGLVVIGVAGEEAKDVKAWCTANSVTYPIALADDEGYGINGIPDAVLVDPEGKILYRGHPGQLEQALIDKALATARPASYAKGLEEVAKLLDAFDFGKAHAQCKQLIAGGKLEADAVAQAERICTDAEAAASKLVDEGMAALEAQDAYAAFLAFERAVKGYAALPRVAEAGAKLAELQKDPKWKREITAGQQFATAQKLDKAREYDKAWKEYKAIVSSFGTTKAGKGAAARAAEMEKQGKLGFSRGCGACEAADAACPLHRKKK